MNIKADIFLCGEDSGLSKTNLGLCLIPFQPRDAKSLKRKLQWEEAQDYQVIYLLQVKVEWKLKLLKGGQTHLEAQKVRCKESLHKKRAISLPA